MKKISTLPFALYRLQNTKTPKLREKTAQRQKQLYTFDFQLGENGLYNPTNSETYRGSNGLELSPLGMNLLEYLDTFKEKYIYELPEGLVVPKEFIVFHQEFDQYSLQTSQSIEPKQFCKRVKLFLQQQKLITRNELFKKLQEFQKSLRKQ